MPRKSKLILPDGLKRRQSAWRTVEELIWETGAGRDWIVARIEQHGFTPADVGVGENGSTHRRIFYSPHAAEVIREEAREWLKVLVLGIYRSLDAAAAELDTSRHWIETTIERHGLEPLELRRSDNNRLVWAVSPRLFLKLREIRRAKPPPGWHTLEELARLTGVSTSTARAKVRAASLSPRHYYTDTMSRPPAYYPPEAVQAIEIRKRRLREKRSVPDGDGGHTP